MLATRMNMNSVNTSGKNLMPSLPAVLLDGVGDELVGQLRDRLQPARHQRAGRAAADQQRPDADHGDHHEQRRVGEGDFVPADVAERRRASGFRIDESDRPSPSVSCQSVADCPRSIASFWPRRRLANPGGAHHIEDACGEAEQQKHDHPPRRDAEPAIERPTDERADQRRRRPVRWKDGSRGRLPTDRFSNWTQVRLAGSCRFCWSSRSPRRWSLAERSASSSGRLPFLLPSRAPSGMVSGPSSTLRRCKQIQVVPAFLEAARTIVIGFW